MEAQQSEKNHAEQVNEGSYFIIDPCDWGKQNSGPYGFSNAENTDPIEEFKWNLR